MYINTSFSVFIRLLGYGNDFTSLLNGQVQTGFMLPDVITNQLYQTSKGFINRYTTRDVLTVRHGRAADNCGAKSMVVYLDDVLDCDPVAFTVGMFKIKSLGLIVAK